MTSAFNFAATKDASNPNIQPRQEMGTGQVLIQTHAGLDVIAGTFFAKQSLTPYPVPPNSMPVVESGPTRGVPSGPDGCSPVAQADAAPNVVDGLADLTVEPSQTRIGQAGEEIRAAVLEKTSPKAKA